MSSVPAARPALDFSSVRDLAAADMAQVDTLIRARLSSDVVLINQIADHIIASGGKRLRPMLHTLAARAAGYTGDNHAKLAAIIEGCTIQNLGPISVPGIDFIVWLRNGVRQACKSNPVCRRD